MFCNHCVYFINSGSPSLLVNYADFASTIFLSSWNPALPYIGHTFIF